MGSMSGNLLNFLGSHRIEFRVCSSLDLGVCSACGWNYMCSERKTNMMCEKFVM